MFLCQLLYWQDKGSDKDGWIYKTADEWEVETGLAYKEQTAARKHLKKLKVMVERNARIEHRLYFRVELDALNTLWENSYVIFPKVNSGNAERSVPEPPKGQFVNESETTTETTPESKTRGRSRAPAPYMDDPAVVAYRDKFLLTPAPVAREAIANRVKDLGRWNETLDRWALNRWNPQAVGSILSAYEGKNGTSQFGNPAARGVSLNQPDAEQLAEDLALKRSIGGSGTN